MEPPVGHGSRGGDRAALSNTPPAWCHGLVHFNHYGGSAAQLATALVNFCHLHSASERAGRTAGAACRPRCPCRDPQLHPRRRTLLVGRRPPPGVRRPRRRAPGRGRQRPPAHGSEPTVREPPWWQAPAPALLSGGSGHRHPGAGADGGRARTRLVRHRRRQARSLRARRLRDRLRRYVPRWTAPVLFLALRQPGAGRRPPREGSPIVMGQS